jgi:hypothetical protein
MAITVEHANIGVNGATSGGTTLAITTTQTVSAGSLIVLAVGWYTTSGITITGVSGGGLTWTVDKQGGPFNVKSGIVSAPAPSGLASSTSITVTFSAAMEGGIAMGGSSLSGTDTSGSRVDTTSGPKADEGDAAWESTSQTILAGSGIVAVAFNENVGVSGSTTSYTELIDTVDGYGEGLTSVLRVEASAGSYTVSGTWPATAGSAVNAVAYIAGATFSAGGGGTARPGRHRGRFPGRSPVWF